MDLLPPNASPSEAESAGLCERLRHDAVVLHVPGALAVAAAAGPRHYFSGHGHIVAVSSFRRAAGAADETSVDILLNGATILAAASEHPAGNGDNDRQIARLDTAHPRFEQGGIRVQPGDYLDVQIAAVESAGEATAVGDAGPFDLEPGQTVVLSIDGGADLTATFTATPGARETMGPGGPWEFVDGDTLTFPIDGGAPQVVIINAADVVDIGAVTRAELAAIITAQLDGAVGEDTGVRVRVASARRGSTSSVGVVGGTGAGKISFTVVTAGTGNVENIDAVTHAEVEAVVEAECAGTEVVLVGGHTAIRCSDAGAHTLQVKNTSTADLGFDNAVHAAAAAKGLVVQVELLKG